MRILSTDLLRGLAIIALAVFYLWLGWRVLVATPDPVYQAWLDREAERVRIERMAGETPPK
ncbi:hypothetical protein ABMA57_09320 [Saccharospirillum sp. HFRX-1]|uniref:hypothetical protein n=1 Tax=unclassified Saccharospirillum TaxID=2633430 RepID=UPI0037172B69